MRGLKPAGTFFHVVYPGHPAFQATAFPLHLYLSRRGAESFHCCCCLQYLALGSYFARLCSVRYAFLYATRVLLVLDTFCEFRLFCKICTNVVPVPGFGVCLRINTRGIYVSFVRYTLPYPTCSASSLRLSYT